jgi:NAD(P)-dependent dehydrogenase (short-subunit alcohol dehydrogenase family)
LFIVELQLTYDISGIIFEKRKKLSMARDIIESFELAGKVAVITGGGGELCGAMAVALGSMGVKVAILDVHLSNAENVVRKIEEAGGQALAASCNVLEPENLLECYHIIRRTWGSVDLLITGAGGNDPRGTTSEEFFEPIKNMPQPDSKSFFDLDLEGFRHVFDLNFLGTFLTVQVFSQAMVQQGSGSIVTISSMSAHTPLTKVAAYSAAKAAVSNFTQWLAVHFAHTGIRVNAIAPGFFMTEQLRFLHVDQQTGKLSARAQKVIAHTPLGRYGVPEDLIGTLVWLLSDASKFVTGIIVPVDGGFSAYSI